MTQILWLPLIKKRDALKEKKKRKEKKRKRKIVNLKRRCRRYSILMILDLLYNVFIKKAPRSVKLWTKTKLIFNRFCKGFFCQCAFRATLQRQHTLKVANSR